MHTKAEKIKHVPAYRTGRIDISLPVSIRLVFMGDSITYGQYVDAPLRWTEIVTERLLREFYNTAVNIHTVNSGVSGETTRQGLERFPQSVQNHRPDIMTLQFGLNDCNCWVTDEGLPRVSETAYRANLVEMVDRARRFGAQQIVLSTNHPTLRTKILLSGDSLETRRKRYNDIVRDVAHETNVRLADIEEAFKPIPEDDLRSLLLDYPDQLHLSVAGHRHYAEAIYPFVKTAATEVVESKQGISA